MRRIFAITFVVMFALNLLSPTTGYSVQTENNSARLNYTIGVEMPSHQPVVLVTRVPYSLKYEALFQPRAKQIGETIRSNVIGRATSPNIFTLVQTKTQDSPLIRRRSITSLSNAANLTNNITALNLSNMMMPEQTRNMTFPSNLTSTVTATIPENLSVLM